MMVLEIKGVDMVVKGLARAGKRGKRGGTEGLIKAGEYVMRESLKIVPVQVGFLKGSWFVHKDSPTEVVIGYNGPEQGAGGKEGGYAIHVHEIPNPPHAHGREFNIKHAAEIEAAKGTWRGTAMGGMFKRKPEEQWKFLEKPIRENVKQIIKIVRDHVKKFIF